MNQFISKSLSEIVNENAETASVFEKYHLDYCCKGKRSLLQACSEQNASVDKVVADLENIYSDKPTALDFTALTLSELSDYIVNTHHSYIKSKMPQIISYLQKVVPKHGPLHTELFQIAELFSELDTEMTCHLKKEEDVIFPAMIQLENNHLQPELYNAQRNGVLAKSLFDLENEHEHAGDIMSSINKLTGNYLASAEACTTFKLLYASLQAFELDLHQHVHLENSILFPKALALEKEKRNTSSN